ncbi:SSU rRNA (adenine(1518)-N(6)/adenine(1519)-N(6))-dimethyltransferase [hydrothermal vent metagenome]|uniref:SSU rRNA (Adenine(1518)-N(6)/adenine(1519)-N(6))-dimethyltransferase n=1 Tax=hydrothermal vent metagenome TaxID=652676 RepID=A0A3B0V610_9ZZZZ
MAKVKPKKHLGQHFLKDTDIAQKIVNSLTNHNGYKQLIEVGPGMGVLTQFLIKNECELTIIDIDQESVNYLKKEFFELKSNIIYGDFLKTDWQQHFSEPFAIIGNFPYNISSQIFFKVLEMRSSVEEVVGMIQKEVAQRIASPPGNKTYGILSVLLQAYYSIDYLFMVEPELFTPPPKVDSAVIRLKRNNTTTLNCDEKLFFRVVKQGFQTRRKTLRNALKPLALPISINDDIQLNLRAEQLSVDDFVLLTQKIEKGWKK